MGVSSHKAQPVYQLPHPSRNLLWTQKNIVSIFEVGEGVEINEVIASGSSLHEPDEHTALDQFAARLLLLAVRNLLAHKTEIVKCRHA
jgi:hypothetical protein